MALIPNKDFSCTSGLCKPLTTQVKALYVRLQTELNRFNRDKGFEPLAPDGVIGAKTASAAYAVMPEIFTGIFAPQRSLIIAAQLAVDPDRFYTLLLARVPGKAPSPPPSLPSLPAPSPGPVMPPASAFPDGGLPVPESSTPVWFWIAGIGGLAAIGAGTYYLLKD